MSGRITIYASETGAKLDSDVMTGGGTDDTQAFQAILDKAPAMGILHLVMDGAAMVSGLNVHSNTTIECPNQACGFFQAPGSDRALIGNAHRDHMVRHDRNIMLIGGTWNQDCLRQAHDGKNGELVVTFEFFGVENLTMRDLTVRNQRTFAALISNFHRVNLDNISIDLPDHVDKSNQDGFHFWGPGQFLTIRNIQGGAGDDFLALAPDENMEGMSITDVHIDGVFLDNADQGIRMLSRGSGRLDRVVVRNVTGSYRSFGFYLNAWFRGSTGGNFGDILIENVNLRATAPNYDYTPPFLFRIGGHFESLTLRNIQHNHPIDNRIFATVGFAFAKAIFVPADTPIESYCHIGSMVFDGLQINEADGDAPIDSYIDVTCPVDCLTIANVIHRRAASLPRGGSLLRLSAGARVGALVVHDVTAHRLDHIVSADAGSVSDAMLDSIRLLDSDGPLVTAEGGWIGRQCVNGKQIE